MTVSRNVLNKTDAARLDGLERVVRCGLQSFAEVAAALMTIRDDGLYKQYASSFDAYVQIRFEISRAYAYRYIAAAETVQLLTSGDSPIGESVTESVVRPLAALPPEERKPAYEEAVSAAKADGRKKPTAAYTSAAVAARRKEKRAERRAPELRNAEASEPATGSSADTPEVGAPTGARHEGESGAVQDRLTSAESDVGLEAPAEPALPQSDHPLVPPDSTPAVRVVGVVATDVVGLLTFSQRQLTRDELTAMSDDDENRMLALGRWCQQVVSARRRVLAQPKETAAA